MNTFKMKTVGAIAACIFLLAWAPVTHLGAQAIDLSKMTPDERKVAQSKIEAASRVDW